MKRTLYALMGLLVILALVLGACAKETEAPTEEPMVEPTEEPMVEPTEEPVVEPTEEPAVTGLYNGMSAEELQAAGWVVIAAGGGSTPGLGFRVLCKPALASRLAMRKPRAAADSGSGIATTATSW